MKTNSIPNTRQLVALIVAIVVGAITRLPSARADTHTWFSNADGYWSDPGHWDEGVVPSAGDTLIFEEPGVLNGVMATNDLAPDTLFNTIVIRGRAPATGYGVALYGNALELAGGIVASNLYWQASIYMDLTLQGGQTFDCPKTTVYGNINLNSWMLTVANGTLAGVVQGIGWLEKAGTGVVVLSGASGNTFTGPTVVSGGSLWLGKTAGNAIPGALIVSNATVQLLGADQIADAWPVAVNSGGMLDLNTFSETIGPLAMSGGSISNGTLTLNGDVTATSSASGAARISGALDLGTVTRRFDIGDGPQDPDMVIDATVSGAGGFSKTNSGTLQLAGTNANTYAGPTTVNAGVLQLDKPSGIAAIRGALQVGGGAVQWLANDQIPEDVPIVVNSPGSLQLNNQSESIGPLTLKGGAISTGTGVLSLTTNATGSGGGIAGYLSLGNADRTFEVSSLLTISAEISGTGGISKTGLGTLRLSGSNSFSGTTVVRAGEFQVLNPFALGSATAGTVVRTGSSLLLLGSAVDVREEPLTLFGGAKLGCWATTLADSRWGGPITLLGLATTDVRVAGTGFGILRLSGAIDGPGGFIKTGNTGVVVLSGASANTYAGETQMSEGRIELAKDPGVTAIPGPLFIQVSPPGPFGPFGLLLSADEQIADMAPVTLDPQAAISLAGHTETIGSLSGSGQVDLGAGSLTVGGDGGSTSYLGSITGINGRVTKAGGGVFTLGGTNTYTGLTTILAGTLLVNGPQTNSLVVVQPATTLGGTGAVGNILLNGGRVSPGSSAGRLSCQGVQALAPSIFAAELNGPAAGAGCDQLSVLGPVDLSGLSLDLKLGFAPAPGSTFTLIDNDGSDSVTGTFQGLPEGAELVLLDGQRPRISYRGGSGNDVVLTTLEPGAGLQASVRVLGGNGNGVVDPRECNHLEITLTNGSPLPISNVTAALACATAGAELWQSNCAYLQIPAWGRATNQPLLLLSTAPACPCNADIPLALTLSAPGYVSCTMPLTLHSGCADGGGECVACPPALAVRRVGGLDTSGYANGVHVQGTAAYVADGEAGLQILDVSNPTNVTPLGGYDTSGWAEDVQVVGTVAYVADGSAGLQILDVSDSANVTRLGGYELTNGNASAVQVVGSVAYVGVVGGDYRGLQILDVSNPANVTRLGGCTIETAGYRIAFHVVGGVAYVVVAYSGLGILDVSNPANVTPLGSYFCTTAYQNAVQAAGTVAYVAAEYTGLEILDVSNPANVTRLGGYDASRWGSYYAVQVVGTVAYVAEGDAGLEILDVSNPANVRRLGGWDTSGAACGVQVAGNYAYVADGADGLAVLTFTPVPLVKISPPASGQCCLRVEGYPASPTVVESAPSLTPPVQWTVVVSNSMPVLPLEFNVPATDAQRFYRARQECR